MSSPAANTFVPESVIVYMLRHASAFDWVCLNCQCRAELTGGSCPIPGGKWQRSQGETGIDIVGRLATPRHNWFAGLHSSHTTIVLEAKGDRTKQGVKINRPAYNEMTGGLSAFLLSNLARIRDRQEYAYGWLVPTTFFDRSITAFREAVANLRLALPPGRLFLIGTFDGLHFWKHAPQELCGVATDWFRAKEGGTDGRNELLKNRLACEAPHLRDLADRLFRFEIVQGDQR